ncbi:MAG: hypothetical protein RLZZ437_2954 [Pseudomonadota bacterium]
MTQFEYKVVPAPAKGEKVRGAKTTADRFAVTLTGVMNDLGRDGWEYLRADTLPCEERVGFTGRQTTFQHMLVFRRAIAPAVTTAPEVLLAAPAFMASPGLAPTQAMHMPPPAPHMPPPAPHMPPPAPRVDWPAHGSAPAVGPARPVAAE